MLNAPLTVLKSDYIRIEIALVEGTKTGGST